jgi:hypothetical protein
MTRFSEYRTRGVLTISLSPAEIFSAWKREMRVPGVEIRVSGNVYGQLCLAEARRPASVIISVFNRIRL